MKKLLIVMALCSLVLIPQILLQHPSVYPTGTTIYKPEKCWNGYTIFPAVENQGAVLIDMNGRVVKHWEEILGEPIPNRILPGGYVVGSTGRREKHQEFNDLVQVDWDGNIVWKFNKTEQIKEEGKEPAWMARQHHDWQREGNPVGYYTPGMDPLVDKGKTLILAHKNVKNPEITDRLLEDDYIIEVTWEGEIVWEWLCSDHFDELGFSEEAKNAIYRGGSRRPSADRPWDWMHINSATYIGPNKLYDAGDERFHPDNIIWSSRRSNIIAIIERKEGKIVWKVGPDYTVSPALRKLGQMIGTHHVHMIPKGLPGEGNILIFDNGGAGGYGAPNPGSPTGLNNARRDHSRVIEFNPVTLENVWEYSARTAGFKNYDNFKFYSSYISSAQRLPNGNTLITEGADGRIFEVTPECTIVWEYVCPIFGIKDKNWNMVYRAYRIPYEWVPQLKKPVEKPVIPPDLSKFKIKPHTETIY